MSAMTSQITSLSIAYSAVYLRRRSKKTPKLRVTGLCVGNSPVTDEFPAQRASNTENVSIWWRHHGFSYSLFVNTALNAMTHFNISGIKMCSSIYICACWVRQVFIIQRVRHLTAISLQAVHCLLSVHYSDVIMDAMASHITSLAVVYSTVYTGVDQRKYQSSASLAFVRGIHRWPVNSTPRTNDH